MALAVRLVRQAHIWCVFWLPFVLVTRDVFGQVHVCNSTGAIAATWGWWAIYAKSWEQEMWGCGNCDNDHRAWSNILEGWEWYSRTELLPGAYGLISYLSQINGITETFMCMSFYLNNKQGRTKKISMCCGKTYLWYACFEKSCPQV